MASMGDMLKLMQGGTDRTGFADMADQYAFTPRKKEKSLEDILAGLEQDNTEIEGEESGDEDELSIMQSIFGDDEGSLTSDEAVGQNALLAASFPAIGAAYKGGQKIMQPITGKVTKEAIEAGPKGFMKYFARRAPAMLAKRGALAATGVGAIPAAISLIPELAYMGADYFAPEATDRFEKAVGSGIKTGAETVGSGLQSGVDYLQSFMPESDYVDDRTEDEVARDNEIASQYFMNPYNNGGRVEMQQGGMPMPALLGVSSGSSGNLFSNYMPNPSAVPGPNYGPPLGRPPMQGDPGYNPTPGLGYMQPMPMPVQNFDFGDYLGGADPYAVAYNPYVDMGGSAYDQYGMGMTQEDIDKVFADTDKFSLAAQEAKRKAEEEAAKREQRRRGEGRGNRDFGRERHMRDVQRANRDVSEGGNRGGPGDSNAPGGSAAAGGNRGGAAGARS